MRHYLLKKKVGFVENLVQARKFKILGVLLEEYAPYIDSHELLNLLYDAISAGENDVLEVCLTHQGVTLPPQRMTCLMLRAIEANNKRAVNLILDHRDFDPNECFYSSPSGEHSDLIVSNVLVIAMIKKQSLLAIALLKHPKINLAVIESSTTSLLALATQLALPEVESLLRDSKKKSDDRQYHPQLFPPVDALLKSIQPLLQTRLS